MSSIKSLTIQHRIELHTALVETQTLPSCLNCINQQPTCDAPRELHYMHCLKFNGSPPLRVVVQGCPAWEADIPF